MGKKKKKNTTDKVGGRQKHARQQNRVNWEITHSLVQQKKTKQKAHVSARAATAFPSVKVGILCEHLVPTGRVDIHLLLCLNIMEISLFN